MFFQKPQLDSTERPWNHCYTLYFYVWGKKSSTSGLGFGMFGKNPFSAVMVLLGPRDIESSAYPFAVMVADTFHVIWMANYPIEFTRLGISANQRRGENR